MHYTTLAASTVVRSSRCGGKGGGGYVPVPYPSAAAALGAGVGRGRRRSRSRTRFAPNRVWVHKEAALLSVAAPCRIACSSRFHQRWNRCVHDEPPPTPPDPAGPHT